MLPNQLEEQVAGPLRSAFDLHLGTCSDHATVSFLGAFFNSLLDVVRDRASQSEVSSDCCTLEQQDILRLATRHLYRDWKRDLYKGITCLNEAISHLNKTGIINIPLLDASKVMVKHTRSQAVTLDQARWSSYLKVKNLYDFFMNHFEVSNSEEDLACSAVFSMVINGCHFHKSYRSIILASLADFNPSHSWLLVQKEYRKKRTPQHVKTRIFLSAISVIYLLRLIAVASREINALNDGLFPPSLLERNREGYEFSKKFKTWLDKLVSAFNAHRLRQGSHVPGDITITSITIRELYAGAQIWTAMRYPFFETSYLSQKVVPGQLSDVNFRAFFSSDRVLYTTKPVSTGRRRSWLSLQVKEAGGTDKEMPEDLYITLMNIHAEVAHRMRHNQDAGKKGKVIIAREIAELAESLPYPSSVLCGGNNGYASNYRLLLDWLAAIIQTKIKVETAFSYFSDLANALFFVLADTSIMSLDQYELSDSVFELIHSYGSPRTQRNIKNQMKQFLTFLGSLYPLPKLDWNHPDYWIMDEPMEREIMGFAEFDTVCQEMGAVVKPEYVDMLKAVMILLFYGGLRIHEAALLSHDAVYIDSELNIFIKKSKTRAGKRSLPLHYLLPDREIEFFRNYVLKSRPKGIRAGIPLFSLDGISFPDPKVLADMITEVVFECLGRHITCHQLRHSFASWFLLRWYALVYGAETMELFFVDNTHPTFKSTELSKLKTLFLGEGPEKVGDKYFMHAIVVLSRLLGHAGPTTTVTVYTHTIDVLYRLFLAEKDKTIFVNVSRAAKILDISYPTAKKLASENNIVTLTAMLKYCLRSCKLPGGKV